MYNENGGLSLLKKTTTTAKFYIQTCHQAVWVLPDIPSLVLPVKLCLHRTITSHCYQTLSVWVAHLRVSYLDRLAADTAVTMFPPPCPFLLLSPSFSLYVTLLSLSLLLEKNPPESTAEYKWNCNVPTLWATHAPPQKCWYMYCISTEVNSGSRR